MTQTVAELEAALAEAKAAEGAAAAAANEQAEVEKLANREKLALEAEIADVDGHIAHLKQKVADAVAHRDALVAKL
jgi:hypothetical protein